MTRTYKQRPPTDFHLHLRDGAMLRAVLPFTERQFARATIMPNKPEIATADDMCWYYDEIRRVQSGPSFEPLMTLKLLDTTTVAEVERAMARGLAAVKAYPVGVTTGAERGVTNFRLPNLQDVYRVLAALGKPLLIHAEMPGAFVLDREAEFLVRVLPWFSETFPTLKIVIEHLSTATGVMAVRAFPNVWGTITLHHLMFTLDDVVGGLLRPHHFCKPVAKRPEDRVALVAAAMSGESKFFFGSDSAPWRVSMKERDHGCAGVFSAPVLMPALVQLFDQWGALHRLENFTSIVGEQCYGLPPATGKIELVNEHWIVPSTIPSDDVGGSPLCPLLASETLHWKMAE